jgi:mRNA interferase RelE/StbE
LQILFTKTFLKDLARVFPTKRRAQIEKFVFEELQTYHSLEEIGTAEKMTGYKDFYKIRFGDYRIGLLKSGKAIELRRVLNRKEIYKFFP